MVTFADVVRNLRRNPDRFVETQHPMSLHAFLAGYKSADQGPHRLLHELLDSIDGPNEADVSTRALLWEADVRRAFDRIVAMLDERLATAGSVQAEPGLAAHEQYVDSIRSPVETGRIGMLFAEST